MKGEDSAAAAGDAVQPNGDVDTVAEARLLRQHKGRLEARMRVLEEHNEQLDSQLKRLRQLLHDSEQVGRARYFSGSCKLGGYKTTTAKVKPRWIQPFCSVSRDS